MEKFKLSSAKIIFRMIKQGGTKSRIKQCVSKVYGRSFEMFRSICPIYVFTFLEILL